jgi:uncharacterized protein (DUF4415 family)
MAKTSELRAQKARAAAAGDDAPELTTDFFARAKQGTAHLPAPMQEAIERSRRGRGPQKAPTKIQVTLRLSPDVVKAFKSSGRGWQSRIDDTLLNTVHSGKFVRAAMLLRRRVKNEGRGEPGQLHPGVLTKPTSTGRRDGRSAGSSKATKKK